MKVLFLTFLVLVWALPVQAKITREATDALEELIRAELPRGWRVSYVKVDKCLKVTRIKKDLSRSVFPNQPPDEQDERRSFALAFRIHPLVSQEEYRRLAGENARISQEMEKLYEILDGRGMSRKFDTFFPEKEEDKMLVQRYEALRKSIHDLPDFHFRDISLTWIYGSSDFPLISMIDESVQKECDDVREKVVKLFRKYEVGTP
jgi:hypothetical protein